MAAFRHVMSIYEEDGGTYAVKLYRTEDDDPESETGLSAEAVAARILAPPELKNLWWNDRYGQALPDVPAPIKERIEAAGKRFINSSIPCSRCADSGQVEGAPCPLCQAT